jgi:hypothetical protein
VMTQETEFLKAQEIFRKICRFLESASRDGLRMDEAERVLQENPGKRGLSLVLVLGDSFLLLDHADNLLFPAVGQAVGISVEAE